MPEITFSIIIAYYNTADLLKKLLSTIPGDPDIEVIIVDDKSTENLEKYAALKENDSHGNRIWLTNTGNGKGCGAARNIGLRHVHGKWLLFADADDYYLDGAFEILRKYQDSDADIICFPPTSCHLETGKPAHRHEEMCALIDAYLKNPSVVNERRLRYIHTAPVSRMIRYSIIRDHKILNEEIIALSDIMFAVKVAWYAGKIECIPQPVYCITRSDISVTYAKGRKKDLVRARAHCSREAFLREHFTKEEIRELGYKANWFVIDIWRRYHDPFYLLLILFVFKMGHVRVDLKKGPFHIKI